MKQSAVIVSPGLHKAVMELWRLLKRDYGYDFAFKIMGEGHIIAQSTIDGEVEPSK